MPEVLAAATALAYYQVSTGDSHTCAITTAGRAYCWGNNEDGELGDGTRTARTRPTPVAGNLVFRNLSAGYAHTCGVTTDFVAYCWGKGLDGQLGTGPPTTPHLTPARVAGGLKFRTVLAGIAHTCALTETTQRAYCWGNNSWGQLGDGTTTERDIPVPVAGDRRFRQVSAGGLHTCAVTPTGPAYCWGFDLDGQLGDGSTPVTRLRPSLVAGGHVFTQISAGLRNTCAVTSTFRAFCWGGPPNGDGTMEPRFTPRAVSGAISFRRVTAGDNHMCGETVDSKAYCWGNGFNGSLGTGVANPIALKPLPVSGGLFFAQLSAGRSTCGKAQTSILYCWGENSFGQVGDGTTGNRYVPTRVAEPQ
jgi:alpha-tubulin suppressor-like RCC1 family protein